MSEPTPDHAEQAAAPTLDNVVPSRGYQLPPMVGLGGSAGAIPCLQQFFSITPPDTGHCYVVVMHMAPELESSLAEILQRSTTMPVLQVRQRERVEPNHVYVIPPGHSIRALDGHLVVAQESLSPQGKHVAVDLFLRTLADVYGPHAAAVVLSGADCDGAIGIKRIKERGGLTIAQDPEEAEQPSMPRSAIATGMVDWVLPVAQIPERIRKYFALERELRLPAEDPPAKAAMPADQQEHALREVLGFLRTRTGRDFNLYKRATVVRRIARRMQVNGVQDLPTYLNCLRTTPGEAGALLQDLLISVTNFFRDGDCFNALEAEIPAIFKDKGPGDSVRVWVPGCATGEEAYSIAMMMADFARTLQAPPAIQVFATDLDEEAVRAAREGSYPSAIEADVSEDRLRRYFVKEHRGYRVRREIREMVLFAQHDVLKDSPFSRLDLVSCRNLLIYLNREAQQRVFEIFHFALRPHGRLFLGSSESAEDAGALFAIIDKKHRLFRQRPANRPGRAVPTVPAALDLSIEMPLLPPGLTIPSRSFEQQVLAAAAKPLERRVAGWGEMHFKILEAISPPSILVDAEHDILHVSPTAGRFLHFNGGEPSRNLLRTITPALRVELRAALYQVAQSHVSVEAVVPGVEIEGERREVTLRVVPAKDVGADLYLVTLSARTPSATDVAPPAGQEGPDPVATRLDRELERLKAHLRDTVEQYEASTEELKASNEELQAMNEELRSATEELETSREELQSINEELTTVNHELKSKVDELGHSNSDMQNLMDATAIATVFLDRDLRIKRYTPSAVTLFNLIASDLGRPLADLATRLEYPELSDDARRVLDKLVPIEREVGLPGGSSFLARLLPYRTIDDRIAGVVVSLIDITERKRAEEVRLWLSAVVASTADAIISFSMDETILSWNPGAERMFGFSSDEAVNKPLTLLGTGSDAVYAQMLESVRAGRAISNLDTERQRKDGSVVQVSLSISPIRDARGQVIGGTAIARDVTEQRAAAEALRVSEERMRLMIENATEYAIFSFDLDRRITAWNSGAQRLLGYAEKEAIGQSADMIFTQEDRAAGAPEQEVSKSLKEGRAEDDRMHQRKDGSRFWASGTSMLMRDAQGQAVGVVKILRDQTQARADREALEHSQLELLRALGENERARGELQLADAAKDRFLAVLSHELRNPLASIDSAASLLLTPALPEPDREAAAEVVKRQAGSMKTLLDDLLDVSRLKLGRLQLHREKVRLRTIVDGALETVRPMLQAAEHHLQVDLPSYPVELDADPVRMGQVLSNLLTNAIKYTPPGGHIAVRARLDGGSLTFSVSDDGAGIEPGRIADMFEMFTQAQPADDRSHGLGIGLALVKSIVEMHGGSVDASSEGPGKGSEFRVTLPAAKALTVATPEPAPAQAPATTSPGGKQGAQRPAGKRGLILIADDNVDAGWGIARLLEIAGFETLRVRGGADAVREANRHKPDAAILDIGMPDLSGHEVARQLRATEWGKRMVLIAATGWGQESDEREALEAGFDAHMTKPVNLRKLSALVDELLAAKAVRTTA